MATHDTLSPAQLQGGLRRNILAGMFGSCFIAMALTLPLTLFLEALGADGRQLGLSATLQQMAMLVQIPAALWVDRLSRRKPFWAIAAMPHRLLWLIPPILLLVPGISHATIITATLAMVFVSSLLAQMSVPVWFAWMADLVPPAQSGRFWGLRQSITTAAFVAAMLFTGWLLDHNDGLHGFVYVLGAGALLGALDILIHLGVPEPSPTRPQTTQRLAQRLRTPFQNPDFLWVTLAFGVWAFSHGLQASFSAVYLRRFFDIEYRYLVLLPVAGAFSATLTGFTIGKGIDRIGARGLGMALFAAGPALGLFWFFLRPGEFQLFGLTLPLPIALLLLSHFLAGGLYAGIGLCQIHLINTISPKSNRAISMALHWSAVGAMAAMGPLCGGWVLDFWTERGYRFTLPWGGDFSFFQVLVGAHIFLAIAVAIPLLSKVHVRAGAFPTKMWMVLLRPGNIFRPIFSFGQGWINTRNDDK